MRLLLFCLAVGQVEQLSSRQKAHHMGSCSCISAFFILHSWCRCGRDHMVDGLYQHMLSVPITSDVVSSKPAHGEVHSIQH